MGNIVLFDGECNFCNQSVQFIIKRDTIGNFQYASLRGDVGRELLERYNIDVNIESIVLIKHSKYYIKSDAVINICKELDYPWKLAVFLLLIPKFIRNFLYDKFSKNRYKLFGKRNTCQLPPPEIRRRFLD
ncbi:thiol-disulfide oxidoreductase DCC family protein [Bacillus cereus]|uniref:thiol-disulfide oxidoreductase DCC family protein n=1 Tax=Bacillus thuringiensis TaxID=1428 RepID=UPI000CD92DAF|nr:thiol-disulfide oxidoreductase DCC family protein [Bacillus thuringiensis]MEB8579570.1 thiol-disulfide oxidoreductase DCC family protein [Bacillus cereus]MEB8593173.1 thiol-disulfide oxidoreductase DCC family protein [Bacillus cereus]MEB8610388.1 thiol-disulfide oxidoreductase DCC family protein [Bacillus cereus]MEB8616386.1 thiol-disulfide oxidoreductase DCC family protein [Bacillus cereus]MEB8623902.1 thiol-disulfide oxidoreductase DCC family protein [Bacillus cereus]